MKTFRVFCSFCLFAIVVQFVSSQTISPKLYQSMRWRMVGPHRAGRTVGVAGIANQPNVFYIGVNNGGVWKTSDYGRTWNPIFDDQPTGSIGALAVAPSNPNVIYVGTGEGLQRPDLATGDGMFKSTDAGKTWEYLGLKDAQQIGAVIVDPRNENRLFVAVLGHPYGANEERGVFRSNDGGRTWQKSLYIDHNTGAIALEFHPMNPQVIYADMWSSRQGPWENAAWQGKTSGLYKSIDGGNTWRQITKGLPTTDQGLGRIGFACSLSDSSRMYAVVDAPQLGGIYRSDDAGESWQRVSSDRRVWSRGSDFAEIKVHPKNKDIVFIGNVASYKSTDGGKTFFSWKGAPGGDDYHTIWINPLNPDIILLAVDQGAVITVNGGETWSSWYNQPTAQFYHVITDNQFPYNIYGGQQESGSVGIVSRGNDGQITFREWHPVAADEYGYIAPDPLNPNIIYGGRVSKYDRVTGQAQNIAPEAVRSGKYRTLRTMPLLFSPVNPRLLFCATNVLFKTTNGGHSWTAVSPDLSRENPDVPGNIGIFRTDDMSKLPRRGVIYAVGPSYKDEKIIWAGTDDGLVHLTQDGGKSWHNVTPPELTSWSKVAQIDAGHFDVKTAYIAVNRMRLDDMRPHVYRTHDGGKTWKEIVRGIADNGPVNTVREDPVRQGLLFAGTEREVFVSFNDGDDWLPLRLNMPATSIRDLVIHNDDVIVGTHGRSFWVLDDITPLRQISDQLAASDAVLFKPQVAYRVHWNNNTDTPLPPEEPAGENPPDGAVINYYLKSEASEITLEIFDKSNKLVRRFSSSDRLAEINPDELAYPTYWIRPSQTLSTKAGMQRFVWDMHYPAPLGLRQGFPIAAVYKNTASTPKGPWLQPGEYTVKLTVDNKVFSQPLVVKMDPRIKTPQKDLQQQFDLSMACYNGLNQLSESIEQVRKVRAQIKSLVAGAAKDSLMNLDRRLALMEGGGAARDIDVMYFSVQGTQRREESMSGLQTKLAYLLALLQSADARPTTQAVAAAREAEESLKDVMGRWKKMGVVMREE